jgi:hypothetical protein
VAVVVVVGMLALAAASPLRLAGVLAGYAVGAASVLIALSMSAALARTRCWGGCGGCYRWRGAWAAGC